MYRAELNLTSPMAKYFPSGLNETQVAAFILSRAVHVLFPGESPQSPPGEASGEAPIPASRSETAVRLRFSLFVGVDGPPYIEEEGLRGFAFGRAR